ncbi:heme-binding protein [soil metagenome]
MKRVLLWALGLTALVLGCSQLRRLFAAQPHYERERRIGDLEIRRYRARVVAHTDVDADLPRALHDGFARLSAYMFGGNEATDHIAMTEPLTASPASAGELSGGYRVALEMPERHEPPRPADPRVRLDTMPVRRVAVLRFHGPIDAVRVAQMEHRLLDAAAAAGLATLGETSFAAYDPPSTLPALRRNEVWVELA